MSLKKYSLLSVFILLSFLSKNLFAQANDYIKQWKQVDELIKKGLTKSGLDEVTIIYESAKKENNDPQIIKALIFRINLGNNLEENSNVKSIALIEKEIPSSKQPATSILNSILAEMYWNFLQQNRYKFYSRTATLVPITIGIKKTDILTWGIEDFHKRIRDHYLASIKEEKLLQQTKLEPLDAIIIKGNVRYLRPTLYDLLAHRALDYFKNNERDINKPAFAFEIKDREALAPSAVFAAHRFINKDSLSLHYYALLIYQKLLRFHASDAKPDPKIDADIERLNFIKQYGVMPNKDELYIQALKNIVDTYPNNPAVGQANYLIAQEIFNNSTEDKIKDIEKKYTIRTAKELLENIIKKFPESEGGINAKNLLNQILHKELNLTSEKINVPGLPFRTLVTYKNIAAINFRIIEITSEFKKLVEENSDDNKLWSKLISQPSIKSWKQTLPLPDDYKTHSTEIKVDGLPIGEYALLASAAEDFNLTKNPLSAHYFHVSNISYINNGSEYFVLDRTKGKPLANAKVQVWNQRYDYSTRKNIFEKLELLTADKNGYVKLSNKKNTERNIRLEITFQKDKLFLGDYQYSYYYNSENAAYENQKKNDEAKSRIFLFTDRSIYRPGQLVYFKGIGITQDYQTKKNQLLTSKDSITVELKDANYQKVDSIKVFLNEFGSF
ncbi:MAG: MG2 domain-containing protein, partial [Chitinophagaceae bacterium]